jgi:hypothetical protein
MENETRVRALSINSRCVRDLRPSWPEACSSLSKSPDSRDHDGNCNFATKESVDVKGL